MSEVVEYDLQKYYANMENGNSRKFDSSFDYMNCILEETLHQ